MVTHSIIEPPVRTGGIAARSARRPHSAPAPVGGKYRKVHVEHGQVERHVRAGLARVEENKRADGARSCSHGSNRRNGARDVRHVGKCNQTGIRRNNRQRVQVDATVGRQIEPCELGARTLTQLLPRNDVRVVLSAGAHDAVAGANAQHLGLCAAHTCRRVAH